MRGYMVEQQLTRQQGKKKKIRKEKMAIGKLCNDEASPSLYTW